MSQQRHFPMMGGGQGQGQYNDTSLTKIFVGGLAWETQRDTMRRYFEQFGEILEAVVITDKNTGRSKGYGFVTFKDPESAMRACQNPSPIIDGRRANCNLASLGAHKNRPPTPHHGGGGGGRFRPTHGLIGAPPYHGSSSSLMHQQSIPYSAAYGYAGYSQDGIYPLNYYGVYGGQQFSPYYSTGAASNAPGMFQYPFYAQYAAQSNQAHGFGVQYPQMLPYSYLPQQYNSSGGILQLPSSIPMSTTSTTTTGTTTTTTAATTATPIPSSSPVEIAAATTTTETTTTTTAVVGTGTGSSEASSTASPDQKNVPS